MAGAGAAEGRALAVWAVFIVVVPLLVLLDTFFLGERRRDEVSMSTASWQCAFWIVTGLCFNVFICIYLGTDEGISWLSGYVLEYMLSVDNLFCFHLIFMTYRTPKDQTHRALVYGIGGAVLLRFLLFALGAGMFNMTRLFHWIFGFILLYSGVKVMSISEDTETDHKQNWAVRQISRVLPVPLRRGPVGGRARGHQGRGRGLGRELLVLGLGRLGAHQLPPRAHPEHSAVRAGASQGAAQQEEEEGRGGRRPPAAERVGALPAQVPHRQLADVPAEAQEEHVSRGLALGAGGGRPAGRSEGAGGGRRAEGQDGGPAQRVQAVEGSRGVRSPPRAQRRRRRLVLQNPAVASPYSWVDNNCQHFAVHLYEGSPAFAA